MMDIFYAVALAAAARGLTHFRLPRIIIVCSYTFIISA